MIGHSLLQPLLMCPLLKRFVQLLLFRMEKIINLDSTSNGILASEGIVSIEKLDDGRIRYKGLSRGGVMYNTLSVPRGSKIANLTLSDGTVVFLNSASSLKYPVAFTGTERRVEITGEVYFEVAKDASKKFIVTAGGITTEVVGTHFNMNTYDDETSKNYLNRRKY